MDVAVPDLSHPAWKTAAATGVGSGLLMLAVFALLFALPYLAVVAT